MAQEGWDKSEMRSQLLPLFGPEMYGASYRIGPSIGTALRSDNDEGSVPGVEVQHVVASVS